MQQQAQFYVDCTGTPNRSCLMLYDVIEWCHICFRLTRI